MQNSVESGFALACNIAGIDTNTTVKPGIHDCSRGAAG